VFQGGELTPSGGTSAASPIVASVIALLNDARLRAGRPALGFLNPLIYLYANKGFTDITSGQSVGCNGNNTQSGGPLPGVSILLLRQIYLVSKLILSRLVSFLELSGTLPRAGILQLDLVSPTLRSCSSLSDTFRYPL
jgi:hypothetical protein